MPFFKNVELARARANLDLILVATGCLALGLGIGAGPSAGAVRVVLGLPFVLFFPGYALIATLYPKSKDLDGVERLALSLGLSLAVVPLIGLALNYLPWGIRLQPILVAVTLFILVMAAVAAYRRSRLGEGGASSVPFDAVWSHWQRARRIDRAFAALIGLAVLGLAFSIYVAATRGTSERFTEFYILGPGGKAEDYPRQVAAGQQMTLTAGVINQEGTAASYQIAVTVAGRPAGGINGLELASKQKWEGPVRFVASAIGAHEQVQLLLFKGGGAQPYRTLHLWLDVGPPLSQRFPSQGGDAWQT